MKPSTTPIVRLRSVVDLDSSGVAQPLGVQNTGSQGLGMWELLQIGGVPILESFYGNSSLLGPD